MKKELNILLRLIHWSSEFKYPATFNANSIHMYPKTSKVKNMIDLLFFNISNTFCSNEKSRELVSKSVLTETQRWRRGKFRSANSTSSSFHKIFRNI